MAGTVSLQSILGAPNLLGVIQGVPTGIPDIFPAGFWPEGGAGQTVNGDTGEYKRVYGTRKVARIAAYGSPPQVAQQKGIEEVPVKLLHTIETIDFKPTDYMNLLAYDSLQRQQMGIQEVTRQVTEFKQRAVNLRIAAKAYALFHGQVNYDGVGNLLPSSSGAKTTVNFFSAYSGADGFSFNPATNQGQGLQTDGSTAIIDLSWDNANALVPTQISKLKKTAARRSGFPLKYAFHGENIIDYLLTNNHVKELINRTPALATQLYENNEIPNGLMGLTWVPAYNAFFQDDAGNFQDIFDPNGVVFTPAPSVEWLGMLQGTYPVPTGVNQVTGDAIETLRTNFREQAGMFAYGYLTRNGAGAGMVVGDTFLPVLKVPAAVYQLVVKFP